MIGTILGIPKDNSQGIPNIHNVRLAYMSTWHNRLRLAREESGKKASHIAAEIGVSSATFSDWESGEIKKIEGENLLKVCEALDINPRWLIFGKGDMRTSAWAYPDPKVQAVLVAMENMPEYKKDVLVATSNTLAEQQKDPKTNAQ